MVLPLHDGCSLPRVVEAMARCPVEISVQDYLYLPSLSLLQGRNVQPLNFCFHCKPEWCPEPNLTPQNAVPAGVDSQKQGGVKAIKPFYLPSISWCETTS